MERIAHRIPLSVWFALSGILMGVAFTRWYLWWMVLFGLVFFIWLLSRTASSKKAFWYGWLAGITKMLVVYIWIWAIYPMSWAGIDSTAMQMAFVGGYWLLLSGVTGIGLGGVAAVFVVLRRRGIRIALFLFPAALLFGEIGGALLYALLTYAPDVGVAHIYTHGYTGLTLADHSVFKWLAVFGGVYALTLAAAAIAVVAYGCVKKWAHGTRLQRTGACVLGVFVIVLGFVSVFPTPIRDDGDTQRVAVVTTDFTREMIISADPIVQYAKQAMLTDGIRAALERGAEIIILPESARFGTNQTTEEILTLLETGSADDVVLIDNIAQKRDGSAVLSAVAYDTRTHAVYQYDKQNLIAFGEYVPVILRSVLGGSGEDGETSSVFATARFASGIPRSSVSLPEHVPSALFCGDAGQPWAARAIKGARPEQELVAYSASHAWFSGGEPVSGWNQLDWMLKVHALWSGVDIIEAANMAPSAHYRPDGTLGAFTPVYQDSHIRVDMVDA